MSGGARGGTYLGRRGSTDPAGYTGSHTRSRGTRRRHNFRRKLFARTSPSPPCRCRSCSRRGRRSHHPRISDPQNHTPRRHYHRCSYSLRKPLQREKGNVALEAAWHQASGRPTTVYFLLFFCFVHHASYRQLLWYNYATCLECVCATTWKPPYDIPFFALLAGTSGGLSKPVAAGSVGKTPSLSLFTGSCGRLLLSSVAATLTTTRLAVWQQFRRQRSFSVTTPSFAMFSHRG